MCVTHCLLRREVGTFLVRLSNKRFGTIVIAYKKKEGKVVLSELLSFEGGFYFKSKDNVPAHVYACLDDVVTENRAVFNVAFFEERKRIDPRSLQYAFMEVKR